MTNNDDPFGRRDRTIIRPNPGGRRPPLPPGAPGAIAPPTGGGAPPASTPTPPVAYPPPNPTPSSPQAAPPHAGQGDWDGWMNAPAQNLYVAANTPTPMTPAPISPHVSVDLVTVASSPLMRASASLLLLLGRLRASLARAGAGQLMDQVAQAIQQFEIDARAAALRAIKSKQPNTRSPPAPTTSCKICRARTVGYGPSTACWSGSSTSGWAA